MQNSKNNSKFSLTSIVAIGIGAAVFFILGRFLSIPTGVPNTNIETTYPFLALISAIYGPIVGFFVGFIGHTIKDFLTFGPWWSWIICSGLAGLGFGLVSRKLKINQGQFNKTDIIKFNIGQAIVNLVTWALAAPVLDILVYSEPANKVFTQGIVSGLVNLIATGVLGSILLAAYAKTRVASGSLDKE
ncbi:ECF-type riboflavin transporter substrate-binding protein [Eremococcus coleocola]|uniref:UPF0397 protein HMPREF9257_1236 n=1 Tax=Eremococcus coleocola ACS-139-V-Col8 TaxID=908337 RepID=E4KNV4_9LACT|nr:ECF-type riboflavin transporter substrate-binding protein [Eremococcus coleocola]EFR30993.1 hypothetical protein HMPREF9257_1236 [Eremococcus coleocola ACS-139-V-Col8]